LEYSFSTVEEAAIRPPDQLRDVAPEAGPARHARKAPLLPPVFFLDQRAFKPKIAEKISGGVNRDYSLIS